MCVNLYLHPATHCDTARHHVTHLNTPVGSCHFAVEPLTALILGKGEEPDTHDLFISLCQSRVKLAQASMELAGLSAAVHLALARTDTPTGCGIPGTPPPPTKAKT